MRKSRAVTDIHFAMVPDWVYAQCKKDPMALALYVELSLRIYSPDGWALGRHELAESLGWTIRTLIRKTQFLKKIGALKVESTVMQDGATGWNKYTVVRGGRVTGESPGGVPRVTEGVTVGPPISRYKYVEESKNPPNPPGGGKPAKRVLCSSCGAAGILGVTATRFIDPSEPKGKRTKYAHTTCPLPVNRMRSGGPDDRTEEDWLR